MNEKFQRLNDLGAGDFEHLDGTLIQHLEGTKQMLARWSASTVLQDAGLYHAAYGTAGFSPQLVSIHQRARIADIIGAPAEEIVYYYCACDREYFWPQIGTQKILRFRDRFTKDVLNLSDSLLRSFCELTVANELEIALGNAAFVKAHGEYLYGIFSHMRPYLTEHASTAVKDILSVR